jgi:hypothetical protein
VRVCFHHHHQQQQALGFDPRVLAEARIIARAELGQQEGKQGKMEQVGTAAAAAATAAAMALCMCAVHGAARVSWSNMLIV